MISNQNNYEYLTDEELVALSLKGDKFATEQILNSYKNVVKAKAKMYFLVGADRDDIVQEGMIGLFKAIRDFDADKASSFKSFADLCIKRQIITAVKTSTRKKHIPLNNYISLSKPVFDDEGNETLSDFLSEFNQSSPEDLFICKENVSFMGEKINEHLSKLEQEVFSFYVEGKNYQEIAKIMNRSPKSIDNALQRIKNKLGKFIKIL